MRYGVMNERRHVELDPMVIGRQSGKVLLFCILLVVFVLVLTGEH